MALILDSPPQFLRKLGTRTVVMTSAEDALLEWGLVRKFNAAAFITRIDRAPGGQYAQAVIMLSGNADVRSAQRMIQRYFDQHSFSGFIFTKTLSWEPRDLLSTSARPSGDTLRIIKAGGLYFEDWDDGCGLKIWMRASDKSSVAGDLASIVLRAADT